METYADLSEPMVTYGDLWGSVETYGDAWGRMGTYKDLCKPMRASRDLWVPMGTYEDLPTCGTSGDNPPQTGAPPDRVGFGLSTPTPYFGVENRKKKFSGQF